MKLQQSASSIQESLPNLEAPTTPPCRTPGRISPNSIIIFVHTKQAVCPPIADTSNKLNGVELNGDHHNAAKIAVSPPQAEHYALAENLHDTPPIAVLRQSPSSSRSTSPASPRVVSKQDAMSPEPRGNAAHTYSRISRPPTRREMQTPASPQARNDVPSFGRNYHNAAASAPFPSRASASSDAPANGSASSRITIAVDRPSTRPTNTAPPRNNNNGAAPRPIVPLPTAAHRTHATPTSARPTNTTPPRNNNDAALRPIVPLPARAAHRTHATPTTASQRTAPLPRAETSSREGTPPPTGAPYRRDSLIRRPGPSAAATADGGRTKKRTASQAELDALCGGADVARVGVLKGRMLGPVAGVGGAGAAGVDADADADAGGVGRRGEWWMRPRENTAPTQRYVALLEELFGAGSVLRGETKPPRPRRRRGGDEGGRRGRSTVSASGSSSVEMDVDGADPDVEAMDVDMESPDVRERIERVEAWISEIQSAAKGKKTLLPQDMKSLADTLENIRMMDAAEGRAMSIGGQGEQLRQSILLLGRAEHIPAYDEHKVRYWARRMVKHWPVT
ncbi:hypothetical protein C8J57DRAFT_1676043 [Mycena rebaudengoi]|nr:hypothetical protein C8J57DRAFT_1676043 [Mycena rebaudengoi]